VRSPRRSRNARAAAILTPHPAEAARLLGVTTGGVQAGSCRLGKGDRTTLSELGRAESNGSVIAAPDGKFWINPQATRGWLRPEWATL